MNDSVFVDSNIFLYAFTEIDDKSKKEEIEPELFKVSPSVFQAITLKNWYNVVRLDK